MLCKNCGSNELHDSSVSGNLTCYNCGAVAAINRESAEVEYVEEAGGNKAIGKFYSDYHKNEGLAIKTAKLRIDNLCNVMNIPILLDRATNLYITALRRGITRGRPRDEVVCACIYLAYRTTNNPQFSLSLLDFSDHVEINVFRLGHTYLSLKQRLHVDSIHDIDPYLYVEPFARQLELGEHTMDVCETAAVILRRMRKDWICTGRRPAGIAAASLLVAARIHQFDRTYEDISKIARISQNTTRKRLIEFFSSDIAEESLDNIHTINSFESEQDPPCFKEGQRRAMELSQLDKTDEEISIEINELEQRINTELEKLKMRSVLPLKRYLNMIEDTEEAASSPESSTANGSQSTKRPKISLDISWEERERAMNVLCGGAESALQDVDKDYATLSEDVLLKHTLLGVVKDDQLEEHIQDLRHVIDSDNLFKLSEHLSTNTIDTTEVCEKLQFENENGEIIVFEREDQQLDLTGIDDEELEREYILNKTESVAKIRMWLKDNSDYLMEEKRRQEERKKKESEQTEVKKKRRPSQRLSNIKVSSPGEMLRQAMKIRKMESNLDYNALTSLNGLEGLTSGADLDADTIVEKLTPEKTLVTTPNTGKSTKASELAASRRKPKPKTVKSTVTFSDNVKSTKESRPEINEPIHRPSTSAIKESAEIKIIDMEELEDHASDGSCAEDVDYHSTNVTDFNEFHEYDDDMPFTEDFL